MNRIKSIGLCQKQKYHAVNLIFSTKMYAIGVLKRSHNIGVIFLAKYIGRLNDCFIDHVYLFFVCLFVCFFLSSFFHLVFFLVIVLLHIIVIVYYYYYYYYCCCCCCCCCCCLSKQYHHCYK